MPSYLETLNQLLSVGIIILQIIIIVIAVNLIFFRSRNNITLIFFKRYGFYFGFIVALSSVFISLFYSNVIGFPPCELCWIQRIFLYPQAILFGMELYKRDKTMVDYSIALAIFGSLVSLYHVYVENGGSSSLACANGLTHQISCATRYVYEFSYITIPIMALTTSLFIITLLVNYKYMSRQ
ncbi:MAG TPA: disulfide bond formation protein B [Candidatus Paceibacterota bacterium]|nr:disulfide bond formation protein B [Candidatus Paceibacterota bacterium]